MKGTKYLTTILSLILVTALLFTGCGKKEETVTAITSEQFTTLYENAKAIYAETPELFAEDAEKPSIDLDSVTDSEIPVSEAITLNEVLQTLGEENLSNESFDKELDEAITKAEAIDLILRAYEAIAERDGYKTTSELGLNEGSVVGRGDQSEVSNGEYNGAGEDVEVEGEIVEGTALTQEEIDELKANAPSDAAKRGIEAYEAISAGGTYTSSSTGNTFDKVVGTPGEDGWCKFDGVNKTIYYDYDAWMEAASASVPPKKEVKTAETWEDLFND